MNWTEFLLLLSGSYLVYYALNLMYDLFFNQTERPAAETEDVLYFREESPPELIIPEEKTSVESLPPSGSQQEANKSKTGFSSGNMISSGAVSMQKLIEEARLGTIEFTKAIAY